MLRSSSPPPTETSAGSKHSSSAEVSGWVMPEPNHPPDHFVVFSELPSNSSSKIGRQFPGSPTGPVGLVVGCAAGGVTTGTVGAAAGALVGGVVLWCVFAA